MEASSTPLARGAKLVADFQATMVNLAGAEFSAQEARASEKRALQELEYLSSGTVLNPAYIPAESNQEIARSSIDAHIKKVQSEQIQQLTKAQLVVMSNDDKTQFVDRAVAVRPRTLDPTPIESIWLDKRRGYTKGSVKTTQLKGTIQDVLLSKNVLLVKPTWSSRFFNPARKLFIVYVIDPTSLQPLVELSIA